MNIYLFSLGMVPLFFPYIVFPVATTSAGDESAGDNNHHVVSQNPVSGGAPLVKKNNCVSPSTPLETNGKQVIISAESNSSTSANGAAGQRRGSKGNGMITGVPSSLLGDIIAELDDLLDADFFNVQLLSSSTPNLISNNTSTNNNFTKRDSFNEHNEGLK